MFCTVYLSQVSLGLLFCPANGSHRISVVGRRRCQRCKGDGAVVQWLLAFKFKFKLVDRHHAPQQPPKNHSLAGHVKVQIFI